MALGFGSKKTATPAAAEPTYNNSTLLSSDEKHGDPMLDNGYGYDAEKNENSGDRKMSRVGAPLATVGSDDDSAISVGKQMELESSNAIKYRTCSWQKTAALLFSEYICLAIMSFPYSYSVLGLVPGLILTVVMAALVLYTSLVLWEFCLRHPEVRDVCDLGQMLFYNWRWVWYATAVMFLLNNTFIQGLHVLTGAKYLNTMTNHSVCTIGFSAIMTVISFVCSLPRTFDTLSKLATLSAIFTFISVMLAIIFAAIEAHPANYQPEFDPKTGFGGDPIVLVVPTAGTTFVSGMNAFLNISYTFIGQITLPSFIAEMKNPADFPKALWAVTIAEIIVFSLAGGIIYGYTGTQYNTAPAFGSLGNELYKKVSFSFMIPTLIFLGVLYASVSARFIFFRIFEGTRHKGNHTVVGWASWAGILALTWILAFIIAEVIPFFSDLLSLMSSLFDSFFGFIFWGVAYFRMREADYGPGWWRRRGIRGMWGFALNWFIILCGIFMLGVGTYASVDSIKLNYASHLVGSAFSCANNDNKPLSRTGLYDLHLANGGKMVPFAGYEMPVQYSDLSVGESHKWTREKASLFDVGHMVQQVFWGPKATEFLESITPSSISSLAPHRSTLSCLLHPETGGIVDDTVITRLTGGLTDAFYVVTNAACREKDGAYFTEQLTSFTSKPNSDISENLPKTNTAVPVSWQKLENQGLIALQGPLSAEVLQNALSSTSVINLKELYFGQSVYITLAVPSSSSPSPPLLCSRGGYTGEDGFEISIPPYATEHVTRILLDSAGPEKLRLAGLGARDSLRLEAGMCLYGHDLDDTTTPVEAGLGWIVSKERRVAKGFHGAERICEQLATKKQGGKGPGRRRVGLIVNGAPAREGAEIMAIGAEEGEEKVVGRVTSGCPSPTLEKNIAMGYVESGWHSAGTKLTVKVRGKKREAEVVKMPFVASRYWKQAVGTAPG
ncbi:hypothetical protein MMC25_001826 [Agyrium rufum]|nr:hypothetical protein [Agyrium rufum]